MTIYLDHAAATPVDPNVVAAMEPYYAEKFGNPNSVNAEGQAAKEGIESARQVVADILGASSDEIIFVSSGTESVNLAIKGFASANKDRGNHIITTAVEHRSVLSTCKWLQTQGFEVTYLPVDAEGFVTAEQVASAITDKTILVSVIYGSNEIGTIMPIAGIARKCKERNVALHTDACQCAGALELADLGVDMMTLNGAKMYGPKGSACLYVKRGVKLAPQIHGGDQEFNRRAGTPNMPGIVGFAKALEIADAKRLDESARLCTLRDQLIAGLCAVPEVKLNGPMDRLPNNVNVSVRGVEAATLLSALDEEGISASAGSACIAVALEPSHVIKAIGRSSDYALGSIRLTLGRSTTKEDMEKVIDVFAKRVEQLRNLVRGR